MLDKTRKKRLAKKKEHRAQVSKRIVRMKPGEIPYDIYLTLKPVVKEINAKNDNKKIVQWSNNFFSRDNFGEIYKIYKNICMICDLHVDHSIFAKYYPYKMIVLGLDEINRCFRFYHIESKEVRSNEFKCFKVDDHTINIDNENYDLIFAEHAMTRAAQRLYYSEDMSPFGISVCSGNIFSNKEFYNFEVIKPTNGQILLKNNLTGGYFSIILENGHAVAKTFLKDEWVEYRDGKYIVLSSKIDHQN